jgi:molybdopterin-guanine dinucleotide biosynthesis protein A
VAGVLLAGGQSRRMGGGDKCLRGLGGKPILAHVVARLRPQVEAMVLNANGDAGRFLDFGLPVMADVVEGHAGPLAGVLTGLTWAERNAIDCPWVVSVATDTPFFPADLAARFLIAVRDEGADLACARTDGRAHPVFGLWPIRLAEDLRRAMVEDGVRKVDAWTARYRVALVDFPSEPFDPFFNTNRPEDLAEAERLLRGSLRSA